MAEAIVSSGLKDIGFEYSESIPRFAAHTQRPLPNNTPSPPFICARTKSTWTTAGDTCVTRMATTAPTPPASRTAPTASLA